MKKVKFVCISLIFAILSEFLFNTDRIITWFKKDSIAEFTCSEGLYVNENGNITVIPDKTHEIYFNNLTDVPYSFEINFNFLNNDWDLANLPFNVYLSFDGENYEWSNYYETINGIPFLNFPTKDSKFIKFELYLPDYTEFNVQIVINANMPLTLNLSRIFVMFCLALFILIIIDKENSFLEGRD